ncbi:hypothetical protein NMY22_g13961 [Coprinellus aureogranulatus]|nr:hypothetical protein NMY22_g13961 [Coprinellus aureogranulatus]
MFSATSQSLILRWTSSLAALETRNLVLSDGKCNAMAYSSTTTSSQTLAIGATRSSVSSRFCASVGHLFVIQGFDHHALLVVTTVVPPCMVISICFTLPLWLAGMPNGHVTFSPGVFTLSGMLIAAVTRKSIFDPSA